MARVKMLVEMGRSIISKGYDEFLSISPDNNDHLLAVDTAISKALDAIFDCLEVMDAVRGKPVDPNPKTREKMEWILKAAEANLRPKEEDEEMHDAE